VICLKENVPKWLREANGVWEKNSEEDEEEAWLFEAEFEWTIPFPISKFLLLAPPFVYDGPQEDLPQAGNRNHTQTNTKAFYNSFNGISWWWRKLASHLFRSRGYEKTNRDLQVSLESSSLKGFHCVWAGNLLLFSLKWKGYTQKHQVMTSYKTFDISKGS